MIDWNRVGDLRSEIGDDSFVEVVEIFLEEADEVTNRMLRLTTSAAQAQALHFLKGAALNLGFEDLADLCQAGEHRAARGVMIEPDPILACYQASKTAFLTSLQRPSAA
ncbi:Hpt domain-containing protein [Neogemmobacter tilapiae]|nr:Hpt domain-containing protein [Gemmobacter tilapiae]